MSPSKLATALVLGLILLGSVARVIGHPLKATTVPNHTAVVSPAAINANLPVTTVTMGSEVFTVEVASTDAEKAQGLSDRASLPSGHGMLFVFSPAATPCFWMKDMQFGLDFVWVANGQVARINRNVPAPKPGTTASSLINYPSPGPVGYVLEINAGAAANVNINDAVTVTTAKGI